MVTWVEDSSVIILMGFSNLRLNKQINQEKLQWQCLLSIYVYIIPGISILNGQTKLNHQIPPPYGAYIVI